METVYMVCDWQNVHTGDCTGRILKEDGTKIGQHFSSNFHRLRNDLICKLDNPCEYIVIDLIGQQVPERFSN